MAYRMDLLKDALAQPADRPFQCPTCPYCNGTKSPALRYPDKPDGWTLWKKMGAPKFAVAPMVDQSELPFRMMCRKYGATLAYTPMFHSRLFSEDPHYRQVKFATVPEDRPLFVQFCGSEPETVLAAARFVENGECDAVDLNLGCPQGIAKKGHYGSFLMEHWDTIHTVLHTLHVELKVPVTAKMRLFDDDETTLRYARMLRDAGAQIIAVHGRTREMKGAQTGVADWSRIAKVKAAITEVPVLANGNVERYPDALACLAATGCDGMLSAEGLLWDARLFADPARPVLTGRRFQADKATRLDAVDAALEYLDFAVKFPTETASVKAHIWKMVHHSLEVHLAFRDDLNALEGTSPLEAYRDVLVRLRAAEEASDVVEAYAKREKKPASPTVDEVDDSPVGDAAAIEAFFGEGF